MVAGLGVPIFRVFTVTCNINILSVFSEKPCSKKPCSKHLGRNVVYIPITTSSHTMSVMSN